MRYFFYSLFFITEAFGASSPEPKLRDIKEFEASLDPFFIASCIFFALIVLFFLFKLFRRYFLKKKRGGLELEETLEDSLMTLSKYVNTDRFNDEARLFLNHFCYVVSSKDISFFTDNELVEYLKNNSLLSEKVLSNSQKVLGIISASRYQKNKKNGENEQVLTILESMLKNQREIDLAYKKNVKGKRNVSI